MSTVANIVMSFQGIFAASEYYNFRVMQDKDTIRLTFKLTGKGIGLMKEILKRDYEKREVLLPDEPGIISFYAEDKLLYCQISRSIRGYMDTRFGEEIKDKNLAELWDRTEQVGYKVTDGAFTALMGKKLLEEKYQPEYKSRIRHYDQYQYLGISFDKVPYIKVENTTIHEYFYLGPFRGRFFLYDIVDIISEHFNLPACQGEDHPCDLFDDKICKGYCVNNEELLKADLVKYYLLPKKEIVDLLDEMKERYLDELQFTAAERVRIQHQELSRFYNQISFLMVTKHLDLQFKHQGQQIEIRNGMIAKIGDVAITLPENEYQKTELYAVEKSELDERWIVFNEIKNIFPEALSAGYKDTVRELRAYLLKEKS